MSLKKKFGKYFPRRINLFRQFKVLNPFYVKDCFYDQSSNLSFICTLPLTFDETLPYDRCVHIVHTIFGDRDGTMCIKKLLNNKITSLTKRDLLQRPRQNQLIFLKSDNKDFLFRFLHMMFLRSGGGGSERSKIFSFYICSTSEKF